MNRPSIARRLTGLIAVVAVSAAVLVPVVGIMHQYRISRELLAEDTISIETSTLPVLAYLLWTVNEEQTYQLLDGLTHRHTVTRLRLTADGVPPVEIETGAYDRDRDSLRQWPVVYDRGGTDFMLGVLEIWSPPALTLAMAGALGPPAVGIAVALLAVLGLVGGFAFVARRTITGPLTTLSRDLDALESASRVPDWWTERLERDRTEETSRVRHAVDRGLRRIQQEMEERRRTESELARSLAEKEVLLNEVHHRVKNNLQLVMSLLSLQRAAVADPAARIALEDGQHRIMSMAVVHQLLYHGKTSDSVYLSEYLESLAAGFRPPATRGVEVRVDASPVPVTIDTAIPVGLVVTELATNALKHAFPADACGAITITATAHPERPIVTVSVADTGCGLPGDWSLSENASLGMQIVSALVSQLETDLSVVSDASGTRFSFDIRPVGAQRQATPPADAVADRGA